MGKDDEQEDPQDNSLGPLISHIPEEVLIHILYNVPVRHLIRFQIVSKQWLDLISNPVRPESCLSTAMRRYSPALCGFFSYYSPFPYSSCHRPSSTSFLPVIPLTTPHDPKEVKSLDPQLSFLPRNLDEYILVASSNGFLLFTSTEDLSLDPYYYFICNPFTTQTVKLPLIKAVDYPAEKPTVFFDCNVDDSDHLADYTVMLLSYKMFGHEMMINTLTKDHGEDLKWVQHRLESSWSLCQNFHMYGYRTVVGAINGVFYVIVDIYEARIVAIDGNQSFAFRATKLPFVMFNDKYQLSCCIYEARIYCLLMKRSGILQLWVSRKLPGASGSGHDYGWQSLYDIKTTSVEHDFSIRKLIGFHPRNPEMIFFTTSDSNGNDEFKSYDFRQQEVRSYSTNGAKVDRCIRFVPCEWLPWPLSLRNYT